METNSQNLNSSHQEIKVLWEDEHFIAVEKPSGLFTHRSTEARHIKENLVAKTRDILNSYVYPIHRLDRPVSGIVIFGKSGEDANKLKENWHQETTRKLYLALVKGIINKPGTFDFALNDENKVPKVAITHYEPLEVFPQNTFVKIKIDTGRRHQIRRHFSRRMHQVIGDTAHGKGKVNQYFRDEFGLKRIFLHATELEFQHPYSREEIKLKSNLPEDLAEILNKLRTN